MCKEYFDKNKKHGGLSFKEFSSIA